MICRLRERMLLCPKATKPQSLRSEASNWEGETPCRAALLRSRPWS